MSSKADLGEQLAMLGTPGELSVLPAQQGPQRHGCTFHPEAPAPVGHGRVGTGSVCQICPVLKESLNHPSLFW